MNEQHTAGCGVRIAIVRAREKKSAIFTNCDILCLYPTWTLLPGLLLLHGICFNHVLLHTMLQVVQVCICLCITIQVGKEETNFFSLLQLLSFLQSNCPCTQCTLRTKTKTVRHLYATCTAPLLDSVASVTFVILPTLHSHTL